MGLQSGSNITTTTTMADHDTKLIISLQARGLRVMDTFSKSDPMCVLYRKCGVRGEWEEVGRTETLENPLDPEWQTSFTLDYYFHHLQEEPRWIGDFGVSVR